MNRRRAGATAVVLAAGIVVAALLLAFTHHTSPKPVAAPALHHGAPVLHRGQTKFIRHAKEGETITCSDGDLIARAKVVVSHGVPQANGKDVFSPAGSLSLQLKSLADGTVMASCS